MNIIESNKTYIHYGNTRFDKSKVRPITYHLCDKPRGGFWGSPVDTDWGWKDWCESEDFRDCDDDISFKFRLKEGNRILFIEKEEDLRGVPIDYEADKVWSFLRRCPVDFSKLSRMVDGMEVSHKLDYCFVHDAFYSWDCDSVLIFNPEIVVPLYDSQKMQAV